MKKLIFSATLILSLGLAACGDDSTAIKDTDEPKATANNATESNKEESASEETEVENENVEENDELRVENVYTNKELGISGEVGPMKYNISAVQLKKITIKNDSAATLFDAKIGDEVHGITIAFDGENTSDEDISFYLGQATIITNTKEQLEPDMLMSEHIEGDYLGKVVHEGYNFYVLKKSTVNQIESIEVRISAPLNSNWDSLGEDVVQKIEIK